MIRIKRHACAAPYCSASIPTLHTFCPGHWRALPPELRAQITAHHQPGQEAGEVAPRHRWLAAVARGAQHHAAAEGRQAEVVRLQIAIADLDRLADRDKEPAA